MVELSVNNVLEVQDNMLLPVGPHVLQSKPTILSLHYH